MVEYAIMEKSEEVEEMALITCPECRNQISDRAERCSHCGLPLKNFYEQKVDQTVEKQDSEALDYRNLSNTLLSFDKDWQHTKWDSPTAILYAGKDHLTVWETVDDFAQRFGCTVTVMENGEHWFHTEEQLAVLDAWLRRELYCAGKKHP